MFVLSTRPLQSSNREHSDIDDCLEDKRKDMLVTYARLELAVLTILGLACFFLYFLFL